jgi:serine/threonine-protein kinase
VVAPDLAAPVSSQPAENESWLREAARLPERASDPVRPGDVVAGKYRVDRTLGKGGMGVVFAATHLRLEQRVAIKLLRSTEAPGHEATKRFLREAQAAARIESEHVARVVDVGSHDDGTPYIVMEYLEGSDFASILSQRAVLPVVESVDYILQACEGVAEAHAARILHRDLKPSNLFLCTRRSGRSIVKVLDFGISKILPAPGSDRASSLTRSTGLVGSPAYMSPEQLVAPHAVDVRTDIWSLGATLFELVTGRTPFVGASLPQIVAKILQSEAPSALDYRTELPHGLAAVLAQSLEKDRERRHRDIGAFAAALAPFGKRDANESVERITEILGSRSPPAPGEAQSTSGASLTAGGTSLRRTSYPVSSDRTPALVAGGRRRILAVLLTGAFVSIVALSWVRLGKAPEPPMVSPPSGTAATGSLSLVETIPSEGSAFAAPADGDANLQAATVVSIPPVSPLLPVEQSVEHQRKHDPKFPASSFPPHPSHDPMACRPPYFLDDAGHRQYKRECL